MRRLLCLVLVLAGCGGSTDFLDATRADWQTLDLESGRLAPVVAPDPAACTDRFILFRRLPAHTAAIGAGAFARQDDEQTMAVAVPATYIAALELTRAQWRRLAGGEPWRQLTPAAVAGSDVDDDRLPAVGISPALATAVLATWNNTHAVRLRLPSSTLWEAAARAGTATTWPWGEDRRGSVRDAHAVTWDGNRAAGTWGPRPVGGRLANAWGFQDVCGNVWELIDDGRAAGGSWADAGSLARPANRLALDAQAQLPMVGLRLALEP
jgi:formylglycine-generating enzyme required for sulfatase activity